MKPVEAYNDFLSNKRQNMSVPGFSFDVNTFEDLIDSWTPMENIPKILGCRTDDLDVFCLKVYRMNFKETYVMLSAISDSLCRKAFSNLAKAGNPTAINIVSKHFMKLEEDKQQDLNIRIVNDLNQDKEV